MKHFFISVLMVNAQIFSLSGCDSSTKPAGLPSLTQKSESMAFAAEQDAFSKTILPVDNVKVEYNLQIEKERENFKNECLKDRKVQDLDYQRYLKSKKYWEAASAIRICAEFLSDAEQIAKVANAEIKYYKEQISKNNAPAKKLNAIESLIKYYPEQGKQYENLISDLTVRVASSKFNEELAKMKSEGVSVGMTQYEVRASSWGRPRRINRTSNALGTTEQWVYSGGYLYFENGILTIIQN